MPYTSDVRDEPQQVKYHIGFPKGLNTVQDFSLIDDRNLSVTTNAIIVVDGITRRKGTEKSFDEGGATYVYGSGFFNVKSLGTSYYLRMALVGASCRLQKLVGTSWTDVSAVTTWGAYPATFVQARDKMFIYNGNDALRYLASDGSTITTYTSVSTPTNLTVTPTGTTGTTSYSYRVEAINATGRTVACARVTTTTGNATLSTSNYNELAWDSMAGATAYNVFGRKSTGLGEAYLDTVYTNAYNDTGADTPATALLPNENNTTGGIKAKYAIFAPMGRQFAIGVTEGTTYYPTRLYYSGVLDYIDAFVGGDYGGGWVEVRSNDGGEIVDVVPYQNGVLVIKTNGLFKFYFTTAGLPALDEITTAHGGVGFRAGKLIDMDYVFVAQKDNRYAVVTVGQQQNYVGDQLRTNDVSIFISEDLSTVGRSQASEIATFLFDYKFGFTFAKSSQTENTQGYVLDTRFGGWVYWTGDPMKCTHYSTYDDGTTVSLYGGSNTDGYMIKLFVDSTDDNGTAFRTIVSTKAYNQGMFNVKKVYRNPTLWFKYVSGGQVTAEVYTDGTRLSGTGYVSPSSVGTMINQDLWNQPLWGVSSVTMENSSVGSDYPAELTLLKIARSLRVTIIDESATSNWLFMGLAISYTPLMGMPLEQDYKVYMS